MRNVGATANNERQTKDMSQKLADDFTRDAASFL